MGEDPNREGLLETPARVAKMYEQILSSQRLTNFNEYKLFEIDSSKNDSIVLIKDIPFYSMCEHHMLPFFGKVMLLIFLMVDASLDYRKFLV